MTATTLEETPQLSAAFAHWLLTPLNRCDPSWLNEWFPNQLKLRNWSYWRQSQALNHWAVQQLPDIQEQDWQWLIDYGQFWLLPVETISRQLRLLGGLFCHQQFSQLILRTELDHLKALLTPEGFNYCRQQAPLLLAQWPLHWHHTITLNNAAADLLHIGFHLHLYRFPVLPSQSLVTRFCSWFPWHWHLNSQTFPSFIEEEQPKLRSLLQKIEKHLELLCSPSSN